MSLGVIRVRGTVGIRRDIKETLHTLHLRRPNHCVVVPPREAYLGMLQKAKDYITWGELRSDVLSKLLAERGRLTGRRPLDKEYLEKVLGFKSFDALTESIMKGDLELSNLGDVKPVFRLNPPKKGYEGTKRAYSNGGALGYRGEAINDLITRMME